YAFDADDPAKQRRAARIVAEALRDSAAAISAQVLGEFFVTITRKIKQPMSADDAIGVIQSLTPATHIDIDRPLVAAAIDLHRRYQISYWDGLIIAAAERAGCTKVLSEDLSDGQRYGTVVV